MIFHLPTHITKGVRKLKTVPINLNWYRNAHHQESNEVKKLYAGIVEAQVREPLPYPCYISYRVYLATLRKSDVDNVVAVSAKFFQDALVDAGALPSDDYTVIVGFSAEYGGLDRDYPRVEAVITHYNQKAREFESK